MIAFVSLAKLIALKKLIYSLRFFFFPIVFAQLEANCAGNLDYTSKTIFHTLGNTQVPVKIEQYGNRSDIVYISLHSDEKTAIDATRSLLKKEGGLLIKIENKGKRNIQFRMGNRWYNIDPNRIFSLEGISEFLKESGQFNERVALEIEKFGKRIIDLFPKDPVCIIALHNNTDGLFSVNDYFPGKQRATDASLVYSGPDDPDNFFLTTDSLLFPHFTDQKYNAILQNNENCRQDGSLSVYCGKIGIRYVNLETQHGKSREYSQMIGYLYAILFPQDQSTD